ncbi:MAG: MFS transporter, partial [Candidatus Peregrinibacteria bacterium]|nr:MFS transporter [Candidatus Peregrinibacteria bacterium]
MFAKTFNRFKDLSVETKSMIFIFWVYEFVQVIAQVFLNIYVFLQTNDLGALVWYNVVFFLGVFFGFCVWGYLVAQKQISMKFNYVKSFVLYFISFIWLLFMPKEFVFLLGFALLNGSALGMFWLGVHTFEMIFTNEKNRDFYSSMISVGTQVLKIVAPAFATALFFISEKVLNLETFELLFWALPFFYLLALPFLFKLPDFVPARIEKKEIKQLFMDKRLKVPREYTFWSGFDWPIISIIMPIISLAVLKNVINIGVFEAVVGILSIFMVIFLSHRRHAGNRVRILWFAIAWILIGVLCLTQFDKSIYFYFAYSLIFVFFMPIFRVSQHVLDLHSVEAFKHENPHFYPGLLYRDAILTFVRLLIASFLGFLYWKTQDEMLVIYCACLCLVITKIVMGIKASQMVKSTCEVL